MTLYQPQIYSSPLEQAIDRYPLTATPETPLAEVLQMMDRLHSSSNLPEGDGKTKLPLWEQRRGSCVLVLENSGG